MSQYNVFTEDGLDVLLNSLKTTRQIADGNTTAISELESELESKSPSNHTHKYAGSSSAGGAATSANKLNTNAGSATQPVYFSNGVPVKTTHTLGASVPSNAKFTDTTYSAATTSAAGLMSAADKVKLDGLQTALDETRAYTDDKISDLINGAPTTLDTLGEIATAMSENADVVEALDSAVGKKANAADLTSHTSNKDNPHEVTLSQLGVNATAAELNYMDGVTSNVQTQLNGKAASSHGTHVTFTETKPVVAGTASTGTATTVSRSDHVHPAQTSVSGNAGSADKLNANAGSVTQPVYFSNGVPVKTTHTLGASVPSNAKFTDTTYSAATTSAAGLMSATDKSKLDGITAGANKYTHPSYTAKGSGLYKVTVDATGHVSATAAVAKSDITALGIPGSDTTYSNATTSAAGLMSAEDKARLDNLAAGENAYVHPAYTPKTSGLYKVTVDATGHVSATAAVAKSDITALGIPGSDTTYSNATTSTAGLMSATDKSKLDGITAGANKYTHPSYTAKGSGLYKVTVDATGHVSATAAVTKSDITALGIPGSDTTYSAATTSAAGLMSAADKSKLNSIDSDIQAQVDGKAPAEHTHDGYAPAEHTHDGYAPAYTYGTGDLTAGTSPLATGTLYFVYE